MQQISCYFFHFSAFFHQKHWKSKFWPRLAMRSTQALFEIYNTYYTLQCAFRPWIRRCSFYIVWKNSTDLQLSQGAWYLPHIFQPLLLAKNEKTHMYVMLIITRAKVGNFMRANILNWRKKWIDDCKNSSTILDEECITSAARKFEQKVAKFLKTPKDLHQSNLKISKDLHQRPPKI